MFLRPPGGCSAAAYVVVDAKRRMRALRTLEDTYKKDPAVPPEDDRKRRKCFLLMRENFIPL